MSFGKLEYGIISITDLMSYFEEAHRCYLFGFNIASAVLCRAIIERALKDVVDPKRIVESSMKSGDSYIELLTFEADRCGILTPAKPQYVLDVRDAGNYAIHSLPTFERIWLPRLKEIVDDTREILLALYPSQL